MISRFDLTTQHTQPISWTTSMVNLFTARKAINSKLPSKDHNFQGKASLPNKFCAGPGHTLEEIVIHRANQKLPRGLKGPGHPVLPSREIAGDQIIPESSPTLEVSRDQRATELDIQLGGLKGLIN
jgi:hypothetical protein